MMRAIVLGVVVFALVAPVSAASLPPRGGSPTQGAAPAAAPPPVTSETPSLIRDALSGLRLFQLHHGRDGVDPAATARERQPADRDR